MANDDDKKSKGKAKPKTVDAGEMKGVTIKSTPLVRQDSVAVGNKMQSKVDVAKAVKTLNGPTSGVLNKITPNANLSGRNETSDNINAMIARRKRLIGD